MKILKNLIILLIIVGIDGCFNMYNDAYEDTDAEYKYYLAVTSSSQIETFPLISNGVPDFINYKTLSDMPYHWYSDVHPTNNYLYVTDNTDNTLSMYKVSDNGTISSLGSGSIATGTRSYSVKVHPSGKYVYVSNYTDGTISMYSVKIDGTLENLGTPNTISSGTNPGRMAFNPSGNFLYVVNEGDTSCKIFQVGSDGSLSDIGSASVSRPPRDITVHPNGKYLYIITNGESGINAIINIYELNTDGTVKPDPLGYSIGGESGSYYLAIHPSGNYLYFISDVKDVNAYKILSGGTLSTTPVSQLFEVGGFGGQFYDMLVHPSGKYLYLADWGNDHIYYLIINNDGTLTEGSTNIHHGAHGLAIIKKKIK